MGETHGDSGEFSLPVVGSSMLPTLFPGDSVIWREAVPADLVRGAIVAYVRPGNCVVAHRVLEAPEGADLVIRGDFSQEKERVPRETVFWVLVRVEGRFGAWTFGGQRGRAFTRLALGDSLPYTVARPALRALLRVTLSLRRRLGAVGT